MDIHIRCTKCGKHLAVDEKTVGMIINCPDCSTALRVPINHEKQICPHCRGETLVANNMNGQSIECSSCHKTFSVKSPNDPKHHACPFCYTAILVPDDFKGQFIDCPTCNQRYMIHRPNQDFQYRQNPSDGSLNGGQAEESPKGEFAKGIPQGLIANSLNRFRIWMLILAVILPIMAIGIYSVVPQSNHVVTIIAGIWVLSLSFINRKIRIVLPSIGLMWGIYRTDEGFTPYDITIIVASALIGIWSYRLPVIGPDGKKITLQEERWENEDRERQRRLEAERRAMQSNGHPLLWSLIIIIALLMVIPGSRHWIISAFKYDSPQTVEANGSSGRSNSGSKGSDGLSRVAGQQDSSQSQFDAAYLAFQEAHRTNRDLQTRVRLAKEAYRLVPESDETSRKILEMVISQGEVTDMLVGRWYKVADNGSLDRSRFWMFLPSGRFKYAVTMAGTTIPFESDGEFKVSTSLGRSSDSMLFIKSGRDTDFKWHADIHVAGDVLSINTTRLRGYEDNFARVR